MVTSWSEGEKENKLEKETYIYLFVSYFPVVYSLNIQCIYSQSLARCLEPHKMLGAHVRNESSQLMGVSNSSISS